MHAGKTLALLSRMASSTEFTISDYAQFDALISGLERAIRDQGENWPMGDVRKQLNSARDAFQGGCGISADFDDNWDNARNRLAESISKLRSDYLADDKKGWKKPTENSEDHNM